MMARFTRRTFLKNTTLGGVGWSHPAYAYRHVFARSDRELVCASLSAEH